MMNRNERNTLLVLFGLLLVGFLFFTFRSGPPHPSVPPLAVSTTTTPAPTPTPVAPKVEPKPVPTPVPAPKPAPAKPVMPPAAKVEAPPPTELHKELIPKNIEIIRCYYSQEIVTPGTTFGFDINGSGFTKEFEKMITVESGLNTIQIKNLKLVTANQIHGEMVVGAEATTTFVYPRVLIKGLPVFSAPEPFAVVRKGEVLTIIFVSMEESGRAGRFRVITNLDDDLFKKFQVLPSTPGLDISVLEPRLPFAVEGTLRIGQRMPPGEYGLRASVGDKEVYRRDGMIRIVRPNVGLSGFVQGVFAADRFHRPGDAIQLYVQGTGMASQDTATLTGKVDEYDMGKASFTYISPTQLRVAFQSPAKAPTQKYSVTLLGPNGEKLFSKKDVFELVPANWIAGVQVVPAVTPGKKSELRVLGRDLSPEFIQKLVLEVDEPGIQLGALRRVDAGGAVAEISVSATVAPGDYWIHLSADGKKIDPPYGSLIKVEP